MGKNKIKFVQHVLPTSILALLLLVPLLALILKWILAGITNGFGSYLHTEDLLLIAKSVLLSGSVAVLSSSIGIVFGFILYKLRYRFSTTYKLIFLIPLLVPPYIFAVAWRDVWYRVCGSMETSILAVILIHSLIYAPLAMLVIGSALSQINKSIEESALMMVPMRTLIFKIVLPLIRPAISMSLVLVFIFSLSEFTVPSYFGIRTFTTEIFTQFSAFYNYPLAIGQSMILLLICLGLIFMEGKYLSDAPFLAISTKGNISKKYRFEKNNMLTKFLLIIFLLISSITPLLLLVYQSFMGKEVEFLRAWRMIRSTLLSSIGMAALGSLLIIIIALWVAYLKERKSFWIPNSILMLSFIIPSTVLGIAEISFFNHPTTNFIYATMLIVLISYIGRFAFIASRIIGNGFKQIPVSLEESADLMGIHPLRKFIKITIPLLVPSIFSAFVLSFMLSLSELGTTIMVYPAGTELLSIKLFTIGANASQSLISSLSLIYYGVTLVFIGLFYWVGKLIYFE